MNLHSLIPSRTVVTILCGMGIAAGIATSPARADLWDKKTVLTVNETIQVRDTVLEPGQYVLKLLNSSSDRHIVQIFNGDQTHIINTILAIPTERVQPTGHTAFTFWETPPGNVRALRTWYYPGDNYGQEFAYPKHLQQVAMLMPITPPAPEPVVSNPEPAPAESAAETAQPEETAPVPEEQPAPEQQPAEVAQNTPPAETPAQSTPEQPAQLPKTGSFYPEIGLCGALLLGLAGLLRLRRQA
jgi:LPXTG-motif cell wall-anchored protein